MSNDRNRLLAMVVDSLIEQLAVIDREGRIVEVNAAWVQFGANNAIDRTYQAVGSNYLEVLRNSAREGDDLASIATAGIEDVIEGRRSSFYHEYPCHSRERDRWFMMRAIALKGDTDPYFVITHHEITERKQAEQEALFLALHDPLTALANRRHFNDCLHREVRRCIRNHAVITLMLIDLDHFKEYNDEHGHPAGDRCLVRVGKILDACSNRPDDLAARLGGDEFALILSGTDGNGAKKIAATVRNRVYRLNMRCGQDMRITASIGVVSMWPKKGQVGNLLFEATDKVLYRAKNAGRNCVEYLQLEDSGKRDP